MHTSRNYRTYQSQRGLPKSLSTDNFYLQAAERSLKYQPTLVSPKDDCLACRHEQLTAAQSSKTSRPSNKGHQAAGTSSSEYYDMAKRKDQVSHLSKTKQFLEQLLTKNQKEHRDTVNTLQLRIQELTRQLHQKEAALLQLRKTQNKKDAQNYYLANASLVHSYRQQNLPSQDQEGSRTKKVKELISRNTQLQEELLDVRQKAEDRRSRAQMLEREVARLKECQVYAKEYQAMRALIDKMQEDKLQSLDRQHLHLQQIKDQHQQEMEDLMNKLEELKELSEEKHFKLTQAEREINTLRMQLKQYREQQYDALRQLLETRDKECLALESRINCLDSELAFIKGKYGYLLKLAQGSPLTDSHYIASDPDDYCIERIGRHNISQAKESLLGTNLSPIKRR